MRMIIDTDPGIGSVGADPEDGLAILYALNSPEVHLEGITVVQGNVPVSHGLPNVVHLLDLAGRSDVAAYAGAEQPIEPERRQIQTGWLAQRSSLSRTAPPPQPASPPDDGKVSNAAAKFLCDSVIGSPDEITVVAIGPLTNIAAAIEADARFATSVASLVVMGGTALCAGNITPAAEFNIWMDPEAAHVVFSSGAPITMVGLDVCHQTSFDRTHVEVLRESSSALGLFAAEASSAWIDVRDAIDHGEGALHLYDSLAVAAAIDPELLDLSDALVEIETSDGPAQGMTVTYLNPILRQLIAGKDTNAIVALGVDVDTFHGEFKRRVTSAL